MSTTLGVVQPLCGVRFQKMTLSIEYLPVAPLVSLESVTFDPRSKAQLALEDLDLGILALLVGAARAVAGSQL